MNVSPELFRRYRRQRLLRAPAFLRSNHCARHRAAWLAGPRRVSVIEENPSINWRIETKCFLDFADALAAGVIQV